MIVYLEEFVVDHLNVLIPILNAIFIEDDEQNNCKAKAASILRLCGRFSPASSFEPICEAIVNLKTTENEDLAVCGFTTFKHLLEGYLESLPPREGMLNKLPLIENLLKNMGTGEFLDHLTKPMLNPFSELFGLVFDRFSKQALSNELEDTFKHYRPQITRVSLTALSIPIFLMVMDHVPELNFRLIKSCIDNTAKLKTDPDARPFLEALGKISSEDPHILLGEIYAINAAAVARASNDLLVIVSLMNYFLLEQQAYPFFDAALVFETAAKNKSTVAKLVLNLHCYCSFFVSSNKEGQRADRREPQA